MTAGTFAPFAAVAITLGAGLVATKLARRLHVPDILLLLLLGIALGPGLGVLPGQGLGSFDVLVATGAVLLMVFEGGRHTTGAALREALAGSLLLATLGVLLTAAMLVSLTRLFLGFPLQAALLAASLLAATDPATLEPILRETPVSPRLKALVMGEAALNDAAAATLAFLLVGGLHLDLLTLGAGLLGMLLVGGVVGAGVTFVLLGGIGLLQRYLGVPGRHEEEGAASLLLMSAAYVLATRLGGSGIVAAFVSGLVRGNSRRLVRPTTHLLHEEAHDQFLRALSLIFRILVFTTLGAELPLAQVVRLGLSGIAVALVLVFVVRPLTVFLVLPLDRLGRWRLPEMLFLAWVRETGVLPAALATVFLEAHLPGAEALTALTFTVVVTTLVLQVPTSRPLARYLGLLQEAVPP